jgi:hypothetical protein
MIVESLPWYHCLQRGAAKVADQRPKTKKSSGYMETPSGAPQALRVKLLRVSF